MYEPIGKMRIPCRCLNLRMSEKLSDHFERLAARDCIRSVGMPQVVNAYIIQFGPLSNTSPRPLQVGDVMAFRVAKNNIGVVRFARNCIKAFVNGRRYRNLSSAGLAVRELNLVSVDVTP